MLNIYFRIVLLYPLFFFLAKCVLGSYVVAFFLHVGKNINKPFGRFVGHYLILICFFKVIKWKMGNLLY